MIPSPTIHHSIKIHSFPHFPSTALVYVIAFCSGCSGRSIIVALVKGYARSFQICINSQIHSHQPSEKERQQLHLDKSPRYSFKITPLRLFLDNWLLKIRQLLFFNLIICFPPSTTKLILHTAISE